MKFINQTRIMTEINPMIESCRRGTNYNILFQGPAGCGKTSLADTFCKKSASEKYSFQIPTTGGRINIGSLDNYTVNFIDEIHKLNAWELLYPLMDRGDKTFVFCTTEYGELPEPFLSRCIRFTFDKYSLDNICLILEEYSRSRGFILQNKNCYLFLARASRGSPRIAKQRFDRIKLLLLSNDYPANEKYIEFLLNKIGIFNNGYTQEDFKYLKFLKDAKNSSLLNITRVLQLDKATIEREIEPYLLEKGNVIISSKGRKFVKMPD